VIDMTAKRFGYQIKAAQENIAKFGMPVLNVGCNTDPAGLKVMFPNHVVNVDFTRYDYVLDKSIVADLYFDIVQDWPLANDTVGLVILGDILEHISWENWNHVLGEARRVSRYLCITVPNDNRIITDLRNYPLGSYHVIQVMEDKLLQFLSENYWKVQDYQKLGREDKLSWWIEYYFITAERV
jgi:hypothetical protein